MAVPIINNAIRSIVCAFVCVGFIELMSFLASTSDCFR